MDLQPLTAFCLEKGMALSPSQLSEFERYGEELYRLNEVMNLTSVPRDECEVRHFIESLLIAELIPVGAMVLDIGTGAGFPAWPLACARPDLKVTAMDSTSKVLRPLSVVPLPNLRVKQHRAEEVMNRESFDVVTGRAVAPLGTQLELSAAWTKVGGAVIPFRTPSEVGQIKSIAVEELGLSLESIETRSLPGTDVVRLFPVFRKVGKTPKNFPRTWAQIKKSPF